MAAKTGVPQADAQKRVDDTIASTKEAETKARQAADAARKATATFAIFTALSLMIGAFVACAAAALAAIYATNTESFKASTVWRLNSVEEERQTVSSVVCFLLFTNLVPFTSPKPMAERLESFDPGRNSLHVSKYRPLVP